MKRRSFLCGLAGLVAVSAIPFPVLTQYLGKDGFETWSYLADRAAWFYSAQAVIANETYYIGVLVDENPSKSSETLSLCREQARRAFQHKAIGIMRQV